MNCELIIFQGFFNDLDSFFIENGDFLWSSEFVVLIKVLSEKFGNLGDLNFIAWELEVEFFKNVGQLFDNLRATSHFLNNRNEPVYSVNDGFEYLVDEASVDKICRGKAVGKL